MAQDAAPRSYWTAAWRLFKGRATHVLFVGATSTVINFLRLWPQLPDEPRLVLRLMPEMTLSELTTAALIIIALTLAQTAPLAGWRRTALMCAAGLMAVGVHLLARVFLIEASAMGIVVHRQVVSSLGSYLMAQAWWWSAVAFALVLFYRTQEREISLAAHAREVELDRVETQRGVMASRLDVLRARVEPEFLFGALDDVRKLYQRDRDTADEMVDALIVYLRAALPQMRGESSTVRREMDLARAYVAVLQVPRADTLDSSHRMDAEVAAVFLPPMILLPLTQAAFVHEDADLRRAYEIVAETSGKGATITIAVDGGRFPPAWRGDGPDAARRTLHAYFAETASIEFGSDSSGHWARVILGPQALTTMAGDAGSQSPFESARSPGEAPRAQLRSSASMRAISSRESGSTSLT